MFTCNLTRFFAVFAFTFLLFSGCRFVSNKSDADSSAPPVADELKSEIPFSTKEPERFQAEIVMTANEAERRTFVARGGARRRYDFDFGAKNQVTLLQTDKIYRISPALRIYAEEAGGLPVPADDWTNFLTNEWLNEKLPANFEKLETVENLTKYRVRPAESAASEVYLYVDEKNGLPVKQEFYSTAAPKAPLYTVELKNLRLDADESLFILPADFKRVSPEEFAERVRQPQK
ncbi:MAG TPA: hypothetical protein VIL74_07765 [Pyrinomonadaceae bacterium]|jgi:outer membrane lipoprotein-sorting protein